MLSGAAFCSIDADGCVTDGANEFHGNNEQCTVRVLRRGNITATEFELEAGWDFLYVGSRRFSGNIGPDQLPVNAGQTFRFATDGSVTSAGFTMCFNYGTRRRFPRNAFNRALAPVLILVPGTLVTSALYHHPLCLMMSEPASRGYAPD